MREETASPKEANFPGTSDIAGGLPPSETILFFVAFPQDAMLRIVAPRLSYIRPLRGRFFPRERTVPEKELPAEFGMILFFFL